MADTTITALPNAAALTGAERVPMDQAGTTVDASTQAIAALATAASVGLGNVNNTSDANKPVSTATQTALDGKANTGAIGSSGLTMSTARLLGRATAATGAVEEISIGSGLSIVNGALTASGGGSGTVTSVALSVPLGFAIAGSPITSSGTLALSFAAGYSLPTTASQAQWTTAYAERNQWDGGATGLVAATGRASLALGSAATSNTADFATAAQGALAATAVQPAALTGYVQTGDSRLSDAREWSAATITQAEAEAGVGTTRRAFTAQRIFQAAAAWWAATASATGQALATAASAAAARTTLGLGSAATSASTDFAAASHTQAASTISDSTTAGRALLTAADAAAQRSSLGLGTFATANAATPPAIGGTTPAAGSFSVLSASTEFTLPSGAPASPVARDLYSVSDTLRYRDSSGTERLLLNATDNLANLASAATARTNLGLGTAATAASGDFLPTTFTASTITYAASVALDMAALTGGYRTLALAGDVTFTTSNRASGRQVTIRITADATQRTLTFPAGWTFIGTKPSNIAASKTAVLSLTFFGTADTDCVAAYGVQS